MARAPTPLKKTSDPAVVVDLLWRDRCFYFVLVNISDRSMRNIQVSFRRKVFGMGGAVNIAALPIWTTLGIMPPGKQIEVTIDRDTVFFANNPAGPVAVSISYQDGEGVTWRAQVSHDFGSYRDFPDLRLT